MNWRIVRYPEAELAVAYRFTIHPKRPAVRRGFLVVLAVVTLAWALVLKGVH